MFAHMPPRERAVYVVLLSVFLFGAGYVGAQRLRQPPKIEINIPKDVKLPLPATQLTSSGAPPASALGTPPVGSNSVAVPTDIVIDVVGAVKSPGVLHLPAGSRIDDAVRAAGGPTSDAQLESINLAARVEDGEQGAVPRKGDAAPGAALAPGTEAATQGSAAKTGGKHPPHPIDLGTASVAELEELPGVGQAMADKLTRYRSEHGHLGFEDLRAIPGLGPKRLEKIRPWVK